MLIMHRKLFDTWSYWKEWTLWQFLIWLICNGIMIFLYKENRKNSIIPSFSLKIIYFEDFLPCFIHTIIHLLIYYSFIHTHKMRAKTENKICAIFIGLLTLYRGIQWTNVMMHYNVNCTASILFRWKLIIC